MPTEQLNPGVSLRVPGATCEDLCRAVSRIPGVVVTQRRRPFWTTSDGSGEFTIRGHAFTIEPDEWDGVYWVLSCEGQKREAEMVEIQAAVERFMTPRVRSLRRLRVAAVNAVIVGAVGSVGLMLRADERTPRFLLVLFAFWVLSPFVALAWATVVSKRWPALIRAALYGVTLVVTLGSLAFYGKLILPPVGSSRAFVFVAVPPASWLLMTAVVSIAALISRTRSQRDAGG